MSPAERQRQHNAKYRDKKKKVRAAEQDLDELVAALEKLPRCDDCAGSQPRDQCQHTRERKKQLLEVELVRARLIELDH